jgi:RimJ/RimL family protein N-acetyltransferase
MKIVHEPLEGSRALSVFMREYANLIERGWARPYTAHNDKHKVIYACTDEDNVVMGGIVYGLNNITKVGWIIFSFTVSEFRRQGVYTALHNELERILRDAGMTDLASHVHVNNVVRQASCQKVGMQPEFYRMSKRLVSE